MSSVLFVDTETNGLAKDFKKAPDASDNWPRIVEIAWLIQSPARVTLAEERHLIQPDGWEIGASEQIHGISPLMAATNGIPLHKALSKFFYDLVNYEVEEIVAHNITFDRAVISSEMMRLKLTLPTPLQPRRYYCTMEHGTDVAKVPGVHGYKWPSLTELHRFLFKQDFSEAHNALQDVRACARCYWALQDLGDGRVA